MQNNLIRVVNREKINGSAICSEYCTCSIIEPEYECLLIGTDYSATISRLSMLSELVTLPLKYSEEGWDGYGAAPLSVESFSAAIFFLQNLPFGFPRPRIVVDPNGDVCFKWEKSRNNRIEVTFSKYSTCYAVIVCNGIRNYISSTSRFEIANTAERVLGWQ